MGCSISSSNKVYQPQVSITIPNNNNPQDIQRSVMNLQERHQQIRKKYQQPTRSQICSNTYESRINDRDSQQNPNSHISPFNCIGTIYYQTQQGQQVSGLGFLISPRKVITALHVIRNFQKNGKRKLYFIIKDDKNDQNMTMMSIIARNSFSFVVDSIKNDKIDHEQIYPSQDYCLLHLQKSVNRQSYIILAHSQMYNQPKNILEEAIIPNIQYSINKIRHTINRGQIVSIKKSQISYDINTVSGQSGSPILVQLSNQIWVAIGLHTGHCFSEGYNSGCLFTQKIIERFDVWSQQLQPFEKINRVKIPYGINKCQQNKPTNQIQFSPEEEVAYNVYQLSFFPTQLKQYINEKLNSLKAETIFKAANILYNFQLNRLSLLLCDYLVKVKNVLSNKLTNLLAMNYASTHQIQYAVHLLSKSLPQTQINKNNSDYIQTLNILGTLIYPTNKQLANKIIYESAKICSQTNYTGVNIAIINKGIIQIEHNQRQGNQLLLIENIANNIKKLAQNDSIRYSRTIIQLYRNLANLYKKIERRDYEEIDCYFQQLIMQKNMWLKLHMFLNKGQSITVNLSSRFPHFKKKQQQFCHLVRRKLQANDLSFAITVIFMLDELLRGNNSREIIEQRKKIIKTFKKTIELSHSTGENSVH